MKNQIVLKNKTQNGMKIKNTHKRKFGEEKQKLQVKLNNEKILKLIRRINKANKYDDDDEEEAEKEEVEEK